MKQMFIETITAIMDQNKDAVFVTADMGFSVFEDLQKKHPERFINTGVTEQASVSIAAGLASAGHKIFFYAQAAFATMRCFEQLHLDAAYNRLNIKVIGVNAGVGLNQLGVSHFSVEDVGIVRTLPGFTIFTPGTPYEMEWALHEAYNIDGPTYLRYSKLEHTDSNKPKIYIGKPVEKKKGSDAVILASGGILNTAFRASALLEEKGVSVALYSVPTIKPLDTEYLIEITQKTKAIFTIEEHSVIGGLGSTVAEIMAENSGTPPVYRLGIPDSFTNVTGAMQYLLDINGLSESKIAKQITSTLSKNT